MPLVKTLGGKINKRKIQLDTKSMILSIIPFIIPKMLLLILKEVVLKEQPLDLLMLNLLFVIFVMIPMMILQGIVNRRGEVITDKGKRMDLPRKEMIIIKIQVLIMQTIKVNLFKKMIIKIKLMVSLVTVSNLFLVLWLYQPILDVTKTVYHVLVYLIYLKRMN